MLGLISSACANLQPIKTPTMTTYTIDTVAETHQRADPISKTILVATPTAEPAYNNKQMIYTDTTYELKTFGRSQWIAPPAQLLQPLLVQSLANTHYFQAVVAAPFSGQSDYRLETRLVKLQQEFFKQPSELHLVIQARIVNNSTQRVIADKLFHTRIAAIDDSPRGGAIAANHATALLLKQLVEFTLDAI